MRELEDHFKALADPTRLRIMNLLLHQELCVCDIQRVLAAPQPSVSRHLACLRHAGLVADRRDGVRIFYRIVEREAGLLQPLFEFLRGAFAQEEILREDLRKLQQAIRRGNCTVTEWRSHPAGSALKQPEQRA